MKTAIILLIIVANFIAIMLDYKMFAGVEKEKQYTYAGIGYIANLIITIIVYLISSIGIVPEVVNASRWLVTFLALPFNVILLYAPLVRLFVILTGKDLKKAEKQKYTKRFETYALIALVILVLEIIYIKGVLVGIASMGN